VKVGEKAANELRGAEFKALSELLGVYFKALAQAIASQPRLF
jgi:hypothetical protein